MALLRLIVVTFTLSVAIAHAQQPSRGPGGFPTKPIRMIVSSAPGGGQDLTTRPVAQRMSETFGISVVVDNRGGASGILAMDATRAAPADGYTLMVAATSMILMGVTGKVPYDIRTAFEPVVQMTAQPYLMVLHPGLTAATPKEFIAFAKSKAGILTYGTSGPGSLHNLGMELLQSITGTRFIHVPYKGSGPALVDLLAGQINFMFTSTTSGAAHVKAGRLRAIAVTSRERVNVFRICRRSLRRLHPVTSWETTTACLRQPVRPSLSLTSSTDRSRVLLIPATCATGSRPTVRIRRRL